LRLDEANSYALLVNVPSVQEPSLLRVEPGDPEASYIVHKIEGRAAQGGRMPLNGPPLPQESIDLIKQWIAGGAEPPESDDAGSSRTFKVASTIPAKDEYAEFAAALTAIFSGPVDASLASLDMFTLQASGGDGSFAEGNEIPIAPLRVEVSAGNAAVVILRPNVPLAPESYQLRIRGSGLLALADAHGNILDGDNDGAPGGDYIVNFNLVSHQE
jgi:hypothetical protein